MDIKVFYKTLDLWSESLANHIELNKKSGKRVFVIALSRKMPRFFDWLQKSVDQKEINSAKVRRLCGLLTSEGVEITTEYAIPLLFADSKKKSEEKIAGIITDDVIIFGATLQRVSMQWWALSGEIPYIIAVFRGDNSAIPSIPVSDATTGMPLMTNDELISTIDIISKNIHAASLPIDMEYPLIYSDVAFEEIKTYITKNCTPEWIYYDVKSKSYDDKSASFTVILSDGKANGYTNDHAKIRLFKKPSGCCLEMIAPSYISVSKLKDKDLFKFEEAGNNEYENVWKVIFNALNIEKVEKDSFLKTIKNDLIDSAILSTLIIWAEYLYCLSVFVKNRNKFFPDVSGCNVHKEDLALILGEKMADTVYVAISDIIKENKSLNPKLENATIQEYVNPEDLKDQYLREIAARIKVDVPVEVNLDALYGISHFSSDVFKSIFQKNILGHHCIGELVESLTHRIEHKHPKEPDLFLEINKWVDTRIDECRIAPKYEIVAGSDNKRYFRRFLLCGSNI